MKYTNENAIEPGVALLHTEQRNPKTAGIAEAKTIDMLRMINDEDRTVADRVRDAMPQIAAAIDLILPRMEQGGRMVYVGAGTSGRLGYLDASECPPTYGVSYETVTCIIAGGRECVFRANEKKEDSSEDARKDLIEFGLTPLDTVVSVSASGRTPYGIGALQYAAEIGAGRVAVSCNPNAEQSACAEVAIEVDTGAEVIMGSTRMKAGTAQKLVMNMLSTCLMVRLRHSYGNVLLLTTANNTKINNRKVRCVAEATGDPDIAGAKDLLEKAGGCVRCAVLMYRTGISPEKAAKVCAGCENDIQKAFEMAEEAAKD